ncbi:hypothetical protein KJ965_02330 [Patescibacteria group bacterium]|nr:hypothetical protein [Patescibacteria group bacterium]
MAIKKPPCFSKGEKLRGTTLSYPPIGEYLVPAVTGLPDLTFPSDGFRAPTLLGTNAFIKFSINELYHSLNL